MTTDTAITPNPGVARRKAATGVAPGINFEPGEDDDGWVVPDPAVLADGTRIQLYKDGEALHKAYEALKLAKKRICLEVYIFASDDTGRAIAEVLCQKAREGVQVYVIYDSFGSMNSDRKMFWQMRDAGVHIRVFHPVRPWDCRFSWRPANRDHRKLLVIDDEAGGLGGLNIGGEYAGSWVVPSKSRYTDFWRDNAIGIVGPAAKVLLRSFANTWRYVNTGGRIGKTELIHNIDLGPRIPSRQLRRRLRGPVLHGEDDGSFGLLASAPTRNSPLVGMLTKLIHEARKSIQLTMAYFAPSDEMIQELCGAAGRGVRVQLMLPGKGDVHILMVAARSFYETLMSGGVEIFERQQVVLHAKTMVIDKEISVIGSTNLDYRSIEYNCELSAVIRSAELGKQIAMLFENDIRFARRIELGAWRRRPMLDRIGQWAVNRARYLL